MSASGISKEELDEIFDNAIKSYQKLIDKDPNTEFETTDKNGNKISIIGSDVFQYTEMLRDQAYKRNGYPTRAEEAFDRACIL